MLLIWLPNAQNVLAISEKCLFIHISSKSLRSIAVGGILLLTVTKLRGSVTGHHVLLPPEILLQVWEQHADRLLLIVRGFGEPAEDAVQEAFIRLAARDTVPDEALAWLVRVARNQLLQWWRSDSRSRRRELERSTAVDWFADGMLDQALDAATVTEGLQQLPADNRATLMMHIWGGLSFEQIATILGVSRSTAHRQYVLAMEQLRNQFRTSHNSLTESPDHEA